MTKNWFRPDRLIRFLLIILFIISLSLPIAAQQPNNPSQSPSLEQQGRKHYAAAQYTEAIEVWKSAIEVFKSNQNHTSQAQTLINLSLTYQHLGQWENASNAIAESLSLIQNSQFRILNSPLLLAQAYDVQGRLQLSRGQAETAIATWKQPKPFTHNSTINPISPVTKSTNPKPSKPSDSIPKPKSNSPPSPKASNPNPTPS
jgi:tetratricopeptide (TPR) repeat protein